MPIDGSENSVEAAQWPFVRVQLCGATRDLMYVVDTVVLDEIMHFANHQPADVREELSKTAGNICTISRNWPHEQLAVAREIREGVPHEEIVGRRRLGADLIVMGHVGRRGPRRILIGSVTERVIEFAHCPVLVVKA